MLYRCADGRCGKLITTEMNRYYGKCYSCHGKKLKGPGKLGIFEQIAALFRQLYVEYREKK